MGNLNNLLDLENEIYSLLESRDRILIELKKIDNIIEYKKGLLIHRMSANEISKANLFEMVSINLEKPILLKEIRSVLPNEKLVWNGIVAKIDYAKTQTMLNNMGIKGLQAKKVLKQIKSLQSDYYKELKLKEEK